MSQHRWTTRATVLYSTLAVAEPGLAVNDWTPAHVRQGFSWREGAVSFATLDPDNPQVPVVIEIADQAGAYVPFTGAFRVIKVPISVGHQGMQVESPAMESWQIRLEARHYALYYAIEFDHTLKASEPIPHDKATYRLTFVPSREVVEPQIVVSDPWPDPPKPLVMHADPVWLPDDLK